MTSKQALLKALKEATDAIVALIDQAQGLPGEPSGELVERIFQELDGTFEGSRLSAGNLEVLITETLRLAATEARPVSVTGKALEWRRHDDGFSWCADLPPQRSERGYFVSVQEGQWYACVDDGFARGVEQYLGEFGPDGEAEAKAACQAHLDQLAASIAEVSHD